MAHSIALTAPITAHGATLSALTLRQPTGKDLRTCGLPYKITGAGDIAIDVQPMHRMIAELAAVPPSSIDQLSAGDWNAVAMVVLGFITGSADPMPASPPPT